MRASKFDQNEDIYLDVTHPSFGFFDFNISQKTKENLNNELNYILQFEYETFYKLFDNKLFTELSEDCLLVYLNEIKTDAISIFKDGSKLFIHDETTLFNFFEKIFIIQYTELRLEKYNGLLQDVMSVMIDDRPYKETLIFIKSQINELDRKINNSLMSGKDPDALQLNLVKYLNRVFARLEYNLSNIQPVIKNVSHNEEMTAFEIALKHWYLEEAHIEPLISGKDIVAKYGIKKVEVFVNALRKKGLVNSKVLIKSLTKVKDCLIDYPQIQKAIVNDIDNLC